MRKATSVFLVRGDFGETKAEIGLRVRARSESEAAQKAMDELARWPWVRELGGLSFTLRRVLYEWPRGRGA